MELNFVRDRLAKLALGGLSQESLRSRWITLALILGLVGTVSLVGCASVGTSPATGSQPQLSANPASARFGDVAVGTRNTQTITLINSGTANLTISQAAPSGNGFSITGLTLPLTLLAGQGTSFNVAFAPAGAGSV